MPFLSADGFMQWLYNLLGEENPFFNCSAWLIQLTQPNRCLTNTTIFIYLRFLSVSDGSCEEQHGITLLRGTINMELFTLSVLFPFLYIHIGICTLTSHSTHMGPPTAVISLFHSSPEKAGEICPRSHHQAEMIERACLKRCPISNGPSARGMGWRLTTQSPPRNGPLGEVDYLFLALGRFIG